MEKVFPDTNVLLDHSSELFDKYNNVKICSYVQHEIDRIKNKSEDETKKFKARRASNDIKKARKQGKIEYIIREGSFSLPSCFDRTDPDNKIISVLNELYVSDNEIVALSNDVGFGEKCESLNIPCREFGNDDDYKGYKILSGDTYFINDFFDKIDRGINKLDFLVNEYLMLYNTDTDTLSEHRFDGRKFVDLKLPSSKIIKGLNSQQRFALDLLNNKDIPIKIVAGGFGSGKTMLAVKTGLHHIEDKGTYKTLMFIRNPIVTDGAEIGFLPGDKSEKIYDFCRPFLQYVEDPKNQFYAENLIKDEKIKMDVVSFLKGVSIDNSFVIMDEAEDLNTKLIKLVGSRIGSKSCVVFTGDWQQSENKYKQDNGLLKLIKEGKGNKLVGIVVLEEDVRSPASRVFAELR